MLWLTDGRSVGFRDKFALGLWAVVKFEKCRSALNPLPKFSLCEMPLENHTSVVGIRPPKLAFQRRKVGQSQHDFPEPTDGSDSSEPRAALRNVLDVARILPLADYNSSAALHCKAREATALANRLRPLERMRHEHPSLLQTQKRLGEWRNITKLPLMMSGIG